MKRALLIIALAATVAIGALAYIYFPSLLESRWFETQVRTALAQALTEHTPFRLDQFVWDLPAEQKQILAGDLGTVTLSVHGRADQGPVAEVWATLVGKLSLAERPGGLVAMLDGTLQGGPGLPPQAQLPIRLQMELQTKEIRLLGSAKVLLTRLIAVRQVEKLTLEAGRERIIDYAGPGDAAIGGKKIALHGLGLSLEAFPAQKRVVGNVSLTNAELTPLDLSIEKPQVDFHLEPSARDELSLHAEVRSGDGELLLPSGTYYALPLQGWVASVEAIAARGSPLTYLAALSQGSNRITWNGTRWHAHLANLRTLLTAAQKSGAIASGALPQTLEGAIEAEGPLTLTPFSAGLARAQLTLKRLEQASVIVRGLSLGLQATRQSMDGFSAWKGELKVASADFRRFRASLDATPFSIAARGTRPDSLSIERVPLHVWVNEQSADVRIGSVRAQRNDRDEFALRTAVSVSDVRLEELHPALCFGQGRVLPVRLDLNFPALYVDFGDSIDVETDGTVSASAFGGQATVADMGAYGLGSEVPEFFFGAHLAGVQLDQLGEWLGFGEMDGTLEGKAEDVAITGWLPTQFDFRLEAKPHRRSKVVFSPEAMKNVVRLFAGSGIDSLPGIADWLAFGWPSRVFGGYDVNYAGVQIFSREALILLETLDPEEILKKERRHFILYGPRFKMPLQTSHYPVVMDAPSMANFTRQVFLQIQGLAEKKALEQKEKPHAEEPESAPPVESACRLPEPR